MSWPSFLSRLRNACIAVLMCSSSVSVGAQLVIDGQSIAAIPIPNLEAEERAVREQLERERAEVDALLAGTNVGRAEAARAVGTLGELYYLYDLKEAAGLCFENATLLAPDNVRWNYLLATVQTLSGELEQAIENLERVVAADQGNVAAWIRLGRLQFDVADYAASRVSFATALELSPQSPAALGGLGTVAVSERQFDEALPLLQRALELQPTADSLYFPLGQALRATGDMAAARAAVQKNQSGRVMFDDPWIEQITQFSVSTEGLFHAGNRALRSTDFATAAGFFESYVEANPEHIRARYNLALCYLQLNRREEALVLLTAVLADDPQVRGGRRLMADVLAESGRYEESLVHFEEAHRMEPEDAATVADWATVLAKLGRVDEALQLLAPFASSDSQEHYARLKYATILATEGRTKDALPVLREIVASQGLRKGLRSEAHYHIGSLALAAGERRIATRHLEQALELDPKSSLASATLAPLVAGSGDLERGALLYRVATTGNPMDGHSHFGLAMSLLLGGRDAEAKKVLEEAVTLLPGNDALRHALARLLAASEDPSVRDGERAVVMARDVLSRVPNPDHAQTLAMAFAEAGNFEQAAALQQQIVETARSEGRTGRYLDQQTRRLELYRSQQAVRSPWKTGQ